jgi:hypothetical protein
VTRVVRGRRTGVVVKDVRYALLALSSDSFGLLLSGLLGLDLQVRGRERIEDGSASEVFSKDKGERKGEDGPAAAFGRAERPSEPGTTLPGSTNSSREAATFVQSDERCPCLALSFARSAGSAGIELAAEPAETEPAVELAEPVEPAGAGGAEPGDAAGGVEESSSAVAAAGS